ncbi:zinc-binding dehydrogenase [Nonomuraea sp. KC401]|uniref:zinc-binding dehydrogenase n=1 Tax=unclassified Nonomuraea TaxID=2593643 RepID=UPI0010FE6B5A|nr:MULTISPECIES: alcohol dehydrogenase catalytic domain-containing protein [unclassified Nonomuraea]NBE95149.1 alcohol dehydrogenase catalytic domain-containing protein [Nonomuraea sp. K271]TLF73405.1 zinc-binding dehydrogenase [Nonomuraea sp. KC401]
MRAAVLREPGSPLTVEDIDLAVPQRREVQVRVEAAGVCHSDLHYMTGDLQGRLPAVLGHEGVGIVEGVGPGVTRVAPGDRVVMTWRPRCGECEFCTSGRPALCVLGRVQGTTGGLPDGTTRLSAGGETVHHLMGVSCFAERCVVSDRSVVVIPKDVSAEVAAIVGCAVVTGVGAVLNVMSTATAEPVVVIGAGGVGLSTVMGLTLVGAAPIVVVDTVDARLRLARELGATHTVDATTDDLTAVLDEVAPGGARWAVDAVGAPATMEQAFASLSTAGTLVAVGLGRVGAGFTVPVNALVQQERRVVGSLYGSSNPVVQIPQILDLHQRGLLPLDRLVGRRFALDEVNEAYSALTAGATGRSVIVPGA